MNIFYLLDKYFDKLNDFKFQVTWRKHFHDGLGRSISLLFFFWIIMVILFGTLLVKLVGSFFGLVLAIFFGGYYAYILIFQFLRFLAKQNTRFVQSEIYSQDNTMNYEDVVETIKK